MLPSAGSSTEEKGQSQVSATLSLGSLEFAPNLGKWESYAHHADQSYTTKIREAITVD